MCGHDGWKSVGDIARRVVEEVAAAVHETGVVEQPPPFGAGGPNRCRMGIGAGSDGEELPLPAVAGRRREDGARVQLKLIKVRAAPEVGTAREVRDSNCPIGSGPPIRPDSGRIYDGDATAHVSAHCAFLSS